MLLPGSHKASQALWVSEFLAGSLTVFGFSMARKVSSNSRMFCIARKTSLTFAEIRNVWLGSLPFAEVL